MPRPAAPAPAPAGGHPFWLQLLVPFAFLAVLGLAVGGGVGAAVAYLTADPPEVVENTPPPAPQPPAPQPADPEPMPPVVKDRQEEEVPVPMLVTPVPVPKTPTPAADPAAYHKVWSAPFPAVNRRLLLAASDDGAHVFAQDAAAVHVFDAKSGRVVGRLGGNNVTLGAVELFPFGPDKVALAAQNERIPSVWHVRTYTFSASLIPGQLAPPASPDLPPRWAVSPDGRHVLAAMNVRPNTPTKGAGGFMLIDTKAGQPVGNGWWQAGVAKFSADGDKLFLAESSGRCRWLRVPGGAQLSGWEYPAANVAAPLVSMSADGALAVYAGTPAGLAAGRYLIDGRTGQVLRAVSDDPTAGPSVVSADGKWLLAVAGGEVRLSTARGGAGLLGQTIPGLTPDNWTVSADARRLVVRDDVAKELSLYALRGTPIVPDEFPAAPLSPPPDPIAVVGPSPFGGPGGGPPFGGPPFGGPPFGGPGGFNPNQPMFVPMPRPMPKVEPAPKADLGPAPPELKARWTVVADMNSIPQATQYAPVFADGGKVVLQVGANAGIAVGFDAATGEPLPGLPGPRLPSPTGLWLGPYRDRVAVADPKGALTFFAARTGQAADAPLPFPDPPADKKTASYKLVRAVSASGRYTAAARTPGFDDKEGGPFKVLDVATAKVVVEGKWLASNTTGSGFIGFTADESKVVVVNGSGRVAWYKLPSGEKDAEWGVLDAGAGRQSKATSMAADGSRLMYSGPLVGGGSGPALVDGRTGEIVRRFEPPFQPTYAVVSPDGKVVAIPLTDNGWRLELVDAATGARLGRVNPPANAETMIPVARFAPDGKTLAVVFRGARRVAVYDVPPQP